MSVPGMFPVFEPKTEDHQLIFQTNWFILKLAITISADTKGYIVYKDSQLCVLFQGKHKLQVLS